MKRVAVFTLSLLFVFAGAALAQNRRAPGAMRGPGAPALPRVNPLVEYLALTAEQKAAWEANREEMHEAIEPLHERGAALAAQLETTNDAAGIGSLVLQLRAVSTQIEAAREAGDAKFSALLTPDQKVKFEAFEAASQFIHRRGPGGPPPPPRH